MEIGVRGAKATVARVCGVFGGIKTSRYRIKYQHRS